MVLGNTSKFKEYSFEYETDNTVEHCYGICWEEGHLKRVRIGSQLLDQPVPNAELMPLVGIVCCNDSQRLPITLRGCNPLLLRSVSKSRSEGRQFVLHQGFCNGCLPLSCAEA